MTDPITNDEIDEVLEDLRDVVRFAYVQGYHEHGVNLVDVVRDHIVNLRRSLSPHRASGSVGAA